MIQNKKGFTLIELIIVMAIIGILAVVAVIAIGSKSADARDARRLADLASVRTALALSCSDGEAIALTELTGAGNVELCDATGSSYISFANIHDPDAVDTTCDADGDGGSACAPAAAAVCDYGWGAAVGGGDLAIGVDSIDPCDYRINFYQEGAADDGYASDEGLVQ